MNVDGGLGVEVSEDAYSHTSVLALSVDQFKPAADQDLCLCSLFKQLHLFQTIRRAAMRGFIELSLSSSQGQLR